MPPPDFPRSLPEFMRFFPDEEACMEYVRDARWPGGFECPQCEEQDAYVRYERRAVQCASCDRIAYLTAGTIMHRSRQPLCHWLTAAFLLVTDKRGISAVQLQRALGIKRHETAYQMLHKLRAAMVAPQREQLRGTVEVDETYVGGHRSGKRGRGAEGKSIVACAAEMAGKRPNRIRLSVVRSTTATTLLGFVEASVEPGSTVVTDGLNVYAGLPARGYGHEIESTSLGHHPDDVLPGLQKVVSNLKAWLQGTFHGAVREKHLQAYLNEYVFRFNRRGNLHAAFQRVLGLGTGLPGPTYSGIYSGTWRHPNPAPKGRGR